MGLGRIRIFSRATTSSFASHRHTVENTFPAPDTPRFRAFESSSEARRAHRARSTEGFSGFDSGRILSEPEVGRVGVARQQVSQGGCLSRHKSSFRNGAMGTEKAAEWCRGDRHCAAGEGI